LKHQIDLNGDPIKQILATAAGRWLLAFHMPPISKNKTLYCCRTYETDLL